MTDNQINISNYDNLSISIIVALMLSIIAVYFIGQAIIAWKEGNKYKEQRDELAAKLGRRYGGY